MATPVKAIEVEEGMAEEIEGTVDMHDEIAEEEIIQIHSDLPLSSEIRPNVSVQKDIKYAISEQK